MKTPGDNSQRLGRGFWIAFWILALATGTWLFADWESQRTFPNAELQGSRSSEQAVVELKANNQGQYLAPGQVNGEPVHLLVDTGATQVAIPGALARRLGLPREARVRVRTASGITQGYRTRIERLRLGPIVLRNVDATVLETLSGPMLLGMSALRQLEMRHQADRLTLIQDLPSS